MAKREFRPSCTCAVKDYLLRLRRGWRAAEVSPPPEFDCGARRKAIYPRECYHRGFRFVYGLLQRLPAEKLSNVWLVHGESVLGHGGHAWVEIPNRIVFDGVLQRYYGQDDYYSDTMAKAWYKFSPAAATDIVARQRCTPNGQVACGGWGLLLDLPWGDVAQLLEIDRAEANRLVDKAVRRPGSVFYGAAPRG